MRDGLRDLYLFGNVSEGVERDPRKRGCVARAARWKSPRGRLQVTGIENGKSVVASGQYLKGKDGEEQICQDACMTFRACTARSRGSP